MQCFKVQVYLVSAIISMFGVAGACAVEDQDVPPDTMPQAEAPEHLSGAAAWSALLGNTISGRTPDGAYSEYSAKDGSTVYLDRDGKDRGRWTLRDPLVCFTFPDDDGEDCRVPEVDGRHGAFVDRDGSRYAFEILPGNPKHL